MVSEMQSFLKKTHHPRWNDSTLANSREMETMVSDDATEPISKPVRERRKGKMHISSDKRGVINTTWLLKMMRKMLYSRNSMS